MATVFIAARSRTGGVRVTSPQVTLPANMQHIALQLVSSNWATKTGSVEWGVEASFDSGSTWVVMGGSTGTFGVFNKSVLLPSIGLSRLDQITALWRIFLLPTANVSLGIQGDFD